MNQTETIDLALIYDRFALALRAGFPACSAAARRCAVDAERGRAKPRRARADTRDSPYSWSARLRAAADLDALDRSDEAIAQLKEMAAEAPKTIGADVQLGDILRNKKRFDEAAAAYNEAIERAAAARACPNAGRLFYDRGVSLRARRRIGSEAEADLEHALELKPDQPLVLNYLGYSWIDKGVKLDQGLKMIEKAVELRPEDGYIVDSLGWAHYRMGDYVARGRVSRTRGRAGAFRSDDQRPSGRCLLAHRAADRGALPVAARAAIRPRARTISSRSRPSSTTGCRGSRETDAGRGARTAAPAHAPAPPAERGG